MALFSEYMIYVDPQAEGTGFLCKLHLIPDLAVIRIRFYDPDSLCSGIDDLTEHLVFHHPAEIQDVQILCGQGIFFQSRKCSPLIISQMGKGGGHHRHGKAFSQKFTFRIRLYGIDQPLFDQDGIHIAQRDLIRVRKSCIIH